MERVSSLTDNGDDEDACVAVVVSACARVPAMKPDELVSVDPCLTFAMPGVNLVRHRGNYRPKTCSISHDLFLHDDRTYEGSIDTSQRYGDSIACIRWPRTVSFVLLCGILSFLGDLGSNTFPPWRPPVIVFVVVSTTFHCEGRPAVVS